MTGERPSAAFAMPVKVRFKHCDPAGIAFYPRLFEFANDTVESWFEALGHPFHVLIGERGLGVPTAEISARFLRPCRYGETLQAWLWPREVGARSLKLDVELVGPEGAARARFRSVLVCVARDAVASRPWPDDVRAALAASLDPESQ